MRYPVKLTYQAAGNYTVRFPDIPEALTLGDTEEEALHHAADALETALDFYFDNKRLIPGPSLPKRGHKIVELPPSLSAKVLLFNEMLTQQVRPAEIARRLNVSPQEMTRILNPRHTTKIDSIAAALATLGKRLEMQVL
jgi:antitoxin HicB